MWRLLFLALLSSAEDIADKDGENSRKVLGSSVVTSVSVIMDTGNGSKIYADAAGKPVSKPLAASDLASPINLLNPDRYEFYTFDDAGDLVKRLMTLEEIQDIIATGDDDGFTLDTITSNGFMPEKRVNDVVHNVQNVLKEEMKIHKKPVDKPQLDTPDVSDSWSMILPAVFGNSGEAIKPEPPITHVTPDTIMIEPTITKQPMVTTTIEQISTTEKLMTLESKKNTTEKSTSSTENTPMINVEIITNSKSTTETTEKKPPPTGNSQIIEIKPIHHDFELTKENTRPIYHVANRKTTKKPVPIKATTFRPTRTTIVKKRVTTSTTPKTTTTTTTATRETVPLSTKVGSSSTTFDTIPQASTVMVQKVAPPQRTTISTTPKPSSTRIFVPVVISTRPTTTTNPTTFTTEAITSTENIPISTINKEIQTTLIAEPTETTTLLPSTLKFEKNPLPTLLEVLTNYQNLDQTEIPSTTSEPEPTSTSSSFSTFFYIGDKTTPEATSEEITRTDTTTINEDLSTLSSENFPLQTRNNQRITTTEVQSTDRTTSEILDQLLLTSTNIYEINAELSKSQTTLPNDSLETTSTDDTTTERIFIKLNDPTEATATTTTDQTLMESIEQLISQAVGTPAPQVDASKESAQVEEMIQKSMNKTMPELMMETATLASNLVDQSKDVTTEVPTSTITEITTTEIPTTATTPLSNLDEDLLKDSVGSLLSQVYAQGFTTLEYESTTVSTESSTKQFESSSKYVPHIINITIISNENVTQSKPAKSDLSLEIDYDTKLSEIKKNSTVISTILGANQEILKTEASSSIQDSTAIETTTPPETTTIEIFTTTTELPITTEAAEITTVFEQKPLIEINIMENDDKTENNNSTWTLVSTIAPHSDTKVDLTEKPTEDHISSIVYPPASLDLVPKPMQGFGLEDSTAKLDSDIYQFVQLCNELAFGFWKSVTNGLSSARSLVISPFAATSLLAMVFLGARGATSGEMNEILKLDDMVTFNPHLIFKNVSESIEVNPDSGVAVSVILRELYSDRSKGKLLGFYKERVRHFYDGHVEEVSFKEVGDVIRRRTNLLVKKNTDGKISEFLKDSSIFPKAPLAGISISLFQTDCAHGTTEGRDGELYFMILPSMQQRRLIPIPATVYRTGFLAGYEPSLDATAAALGTKDQTISTIFIIPGQQGITAPGDGLARLEKRLVESSFKKGAWARLLRSLIPRPGLELQIPRFLHRSVINATLSLKKMGLHDLFDSHKADLKGLNGAAHELHLSDVLQINEFATCGERRIGEAHHKEIYPATAQRKSRILLDVGDLEEPRDYQRAFHDPLHDPSYLSLPLPLRPRQARLPETPRLRFDRPFLYFVRHNPSGLILHMGRFNPRLLP